LAAVTTAPDRRRRADAERNLAGIVEAGRRCFARNPAASMTEIAQKAGVSRVTLYGHFSSREALLEAVLQQAVGDAVQALDHAAPERGDPADALVRLVDSCWQVLDSWRGLRTAAVRAFGEPAVHGYHGEMLTRVEQLVVRGQAAGVFRTDLPASWLVATCYALMHAAQDELNAGRLDRTEAARAVAATLRAALAADPSSDSVSHRPAVAAVPAPEPDRARASPTGRSDQAASHDENAQHDPSQ
jgi:AcrR family transcriptional regulator